MASFKKKKEDSGDTQKPYIIKRVGELKARKFNVEEVTFRARFNENEEGRALLDMADDLHDMFQDIMDNVNQEHGSEDDKARLSISHADLENDIVIHCQPKHNITADTIMER